MEHEQTFSFLFLSYVTDHATMGGEIGTRLPLPSLTNQTRWGEGSNNVFF